MSIEDSLAEPPRYVEKIRVSPSEFSLDIKLSVLPAYDDCIGITVGKSVELVTPTT